LQRVNALESALVDLSDSQLRDRSLSLRYRAKTRESLTKLLPEAFALVREAARRALGMRHFDVQMLGGIAMCQRSIAEMQTGESKTLTATLPMYLYALAGKGALLATVNDYLARRDAELMGPVYERLGLTVGIIESANESDQRRVAYACDITYGTAKEFGFDYLRDRLLLRGLRENRHDKLGELLGASAATQNERPVGRAAHFILVDEADSILIDDAGTPLIISSLPKDEDVVVRRCQYCAQVVVQFIEHDHYVTKRRERNVELTALGRQLARSLRLPDGLRGYPNTKLYDELECALKVAHFFHRDQHYVIREGEIHIVDEFTGRIAEGRKWREGIHQAVEAKEGVKISNPAGQAARITVQDYFLRFPHMAGMSGTVATSASELKRIYRLHVAPIPTNRPPVRIRLPESIFNDIDEKFAAVVRETLEIRQEGRPVLIGTRSIDKSEALSRLLSDAGIQHELLNANQIEQEAKIVAEAGQFGKVTVATNMAGRGTDIKLGSGVEQAGGLHVICTELHDAARIDRQLVGRSGRQGDAGSWRQFLAMDDDILINGFGTTIAQGMTAGLGSTERRNDRLRRLFYRAQRHVEKKTFRQRQNLLTRNRELTRNRRAMGLDPYLDAPD
jgi:preprotein translocase subunit SecA